ncbi:MAG TPA: DegQ family serine endoprotease [Casimicrobiaceae bacterium]|jgi:serine protease Do|nr:DegQ family serine endoprotease [Casimicrobiaceae bacterium]
MQANTFKRSAVALAIAAAFAVGVGVADRVALHTASAATAVAPAVAPTPIAPSAAALPTAALPDFSGLVEKYGPTVVNISVVEGTKTSAHMPRSQMPDQDDLPPLFRNLPFQFQFPEPQERGPIRGVGSGFIVSSDGIILTNAHVVDGADEVSVKLTDKREFTAKVLGVDKTTDIAVLKIEARDLPFVRIGDTKLTKVGEWVVAIGQPFGFENTVTAGIVSAKSRSLPGDSYVPFIQTDAAVNPGNSGGPLFNLKGEVIGVNSQIFSRSGGFQGLAFAVPIDVAMQVKDEIQHDGKASHGRLGISIQEVNQALAQNFGLKSPTGALVASVENGSPGDKAGLRPGDVILKFDGKEISRSSDLPPIVSSLKPGSEVTLQVWRDGASKELSAKVGELKDTSVAMAGDKESLGKAKLGIAVRPLTAAEKRGTDLTEGLVVQDVAGAAERAGVRPGDVIVAVNNTPVKSVEQLKSLVDKAGKTVALLVQRDDARIFIPIELG